MVTHTSEKDQRISGNIEAVVKKLKDAGSDEKTMLKSITCLCTLVHEFKSSVLTKQGMFEPNSVQGKQFQTFLYDAVLKAPLNPKGSHVCGIVGGAAKYCREVEASIRLL